MKTKHKSRRLRRFLRATKAVSALEYAILTGVIVVGGGAALMAFEGNVQTALNSIGVDIQTVAGTVDGGQSLDSN